MSQNSKPIGERLNNPLNVELTGDKWKGMAAEQKYRYVTFTDPVYGIRAGAKILLTYYRKHKLKTVRAIIERWAPPQENPTNSYIRYVAGRMRVKEDEEIDVTKPETLKALVRAMIFFEQGRVVYADATIDEGVRKALA